MDGVEEVRGDLKHNCNTSLAPDGCPGADLGVNFTVSSSTLRVINGSLDISWYLGLQKLQFPKLEVVEKSVTLDHPLNLTHVDLTSLEYFGDFDLAAFELEELKMERFKGFTKSEPVWGQPIKIFHSGKLESLDAIFAKPVDPYVKSDYDPSDRIVSIGAMPNIRNLTFGWTRMPSLQLYSEQGFNVTLTLGGPSTEQMEIKGKLSLGESVVALKRHENLKNLTINEFSLQENDDMVDLELAFNQTSIVAIGQNKRLRQIRLPPEAKHWKDLDLTISLCQDLVLSSKAEGSDERVWYWPDEMSNLSIQGNTTSDFL